MPITTEQMDEKTMQDRAYDSVCAECFSNLVYCWGGKFGLNSMILRCSKEPRHEGLAKMPEPEREYTIAARREFMTQDHGKDKALALQRFNAVAVFNQKTAREMLAIFWPNAEKASPAEFQKALGLCVDYGLDPRLNELFMLPFKVKVKDEHGNIIGEKTIFETVRGIKATRKIARRKHDYKYLDNTPRYMTEEEEKREYKTVDPDRVRFITILKDVKTGAEAHGCGQWPRYRQWVNSKTGEIKQYPNEPKGVDKGNSMENMAGIRSERAALDRLYPAEMPDRRIPVVDEAFVEGEYREVHPTEEAPTSAPAEEITDETTEEASLISPEGAGTVEAAAAASPPTTDQAKTGAAAENVQTPGEKSSEKSAAGKLYIDPLWLKEYLPKAKWSEPTAISWLKQFKVDASGTLTEVLTRCSHEVQDKFVKEVQDRASMA